MSEADTPNNQPLPESTASMDDSAVDLPDATETPEDIQIVNLSEVADLTDGVEQLGQEQTVELVDTTTATTPLEADDPATETPDVSERRTKDADWFALAQKMRQRNRRLLDQVTQLRQLLQEKQEALNLEFKRSRAQETVLTQQTEELHTAQDQLTRLFHALESSHQAAQRQQILIETLSEQLQSSQERVAQLERECALTQQRYNEQSNQLLQAANTCRELRTRLHRQQRQTLQFKAALEKSLEMSPPSNAAPQPQSHTKSGIGNQSNVPKAPPIQPWSAEPELLEDISNSDTLWNRPLLFEPPSEAYSSEIETKHLGEQFEVLSVNPDPTVSPILRHFEETDLLSTVEAPKPTETAIVKYDSISVRGAVPTERAEPLDTSATSSEESAAIDLELEQQLLAEMSSLAEAAGLSEFQSELADAQGALTPESETNPEESREPAPSINNALETLLVDDSEWDAEVQTPHEDAWESEDLSNQEPRVVLPQANWPSPLLYPLRPPKKRKSLAAIELPTFPRNQPT